MKRALLACGLALIILTGSAYALPYSHYSINTNRNNTGTEHNYSGHRTGLDTGRQPEIVNIYRPILPLNDGSHWMPPENKNVIPEPGTIVLLGLGTLGLAFGKKLIK